MTEPLNEGRVEITIRVVCDTCHKIIRKIDSTWPIKDYEEFVAKGRTIEGEVVSHTTCTSCVKNNTNGS